MICLLMDALSVYFSPDARSARWRTNTPATRNEGAGGGSLRKNHLSVNYFVEWPKSSKGVIMSSEASSTSVRSANTAYSHLLKTYQASSQEEARERFAQLPGEFRNKIYGEIYSLAGNPQKVEDNWGQIHVFDELPRLQKANQQVAFNAFDSLPQEQKNRVAGKVYFHAEPTETQDPC